MKNKQEEHYEQVNFCKYLDLLKLAYFAVPNGIYLRGASKIAVASYMNKLKAEGFKPGVPDLVIFLPKFILFVEMKKKKGAKASDKQLYWKEIINSFSYAKSVVCNGFDEAKKLIDNELKGVYYD